MDCRNCFVQDLVYIEVVQVVCTVVYVVLIVYMELWIVCIEVVQVVSTIVYVVLIVYMELWIVYIEVVQVVCTVVARGCRRALL